MIRACITGLCITLAIAASAAAARPTVTAAQLAGHLTRALAIASNGTPYVPFDIRCKWGRAYYTCQAYIVDMSNNTYRCSQFRVHAPMRLFHVRDVTRSCPPIA